MKTIEILSQLRFIAVQNKLNLRFTKQGRMWIASDFKGRQIWAGTLAEVRKIAAGKTV